MPTVTPRASAHARFHEWLVSLRARMRQARAPQALRSARETNTARTLHTTPGEWRTILPCQRVGDADAADAPTPCAGVVPVWGVDGADRAASSPRSLPCPCKLLARAMSKHGGSLLLHLPWERIDPAHAPERRGAWSTHEESDILPMAAALVFRLRSAACFAPLTYPFDEAHASLRDDQRLALREWTGLLRAARLVESDGHGFVSWSLAKDAYLSEAIPGSPPPALTRDQILASLEPGAHVVVAFDTLLLKAAGGSSPETSALARFTRDLHDKGCSLTGLSRYPLFTPEAPPPTAGRAGPGGAGGNDADPWSPVGGGSRRVSYDERGRLRASLTRVGAAPGTDEGAARAPQRTSFQGALDEGTFERLAWMLAESEGKWREGRW